MNVVVYMSTCLYICKEIKYITNLNVDTVYICFLFMYVKGITIKFYSISRLWLSLKTFIHPPNYTTRFPSINVSKSQHIWVTLEKTKCWGKPATFFQTGPNPLLRIKPGGVYIISFLLSLRTRNQHSFLVDFWRQLLLLEDIINWMMSQFKCLCSLVLFCNRWGFWNTPGFSYLLRIIHQTQLFASHGYTVAPSLKSSWKKAISNAT